MTVMTRAQQVMLSYTVSRIANSSGAIDLHYFFFLFFLTCSNGLHIKILAGYSMIVIREQFNKKKKKRNLFLVKNCNSYMLLNILLISL